MADRLPQERYWEALAMVADIAGRDVDLILGSCFSKPTSDVWTALRAEVVVFQDRLKQLANDCR